jgi:hypothetical protein
MNNKRCNVRADGQTRTYSTNNASIVKMTNISAAYNEYWKIYWKYLVKNWTSISKFLFYISKYFQNSYLGLFAMPTNKQKRGCGNILFNFIKLCCFIYKNICLHPLKLINYHIILISNLLVLIRNAKYCSTCKISVPLI